MKSFVEMEEQVIFNSFAQFSRFASFKRMVGITRAMLYLPKIDGAGSGVAIAQTPA